MRSKRQSTALLLAVDSSPSGSPLRQRGTCMRAYINSRSGPLYSYSYRQRSRGRTSERESRAVQICGRGGARIELAALALILVCVCVSRSSSRTEARRGDGEARIAYECSTCAYRTWRTYVGLAGAAGGELSAYANGLESNRNGSERSGTAIKTRAESKGERSAGR